MSPFFKHGTPYPQVAATLLSHGLKPDSPAVSWQKCPGMSLQFEGSFVEPACTHHFAGFAQIPFLSLPVAWAAGAAGSEAVAVCCCELDTLFFVAA